MQKKQKNHLNILKQTMVWLMVVALFMGTLPTPTLFALSDGDLSFVQPPVNAATEVEEPAREEAGTEENVEASPENAENSASANEASATDSSESAIPEAEAVAEQPALAGTPEVVGTPRSAELAADTEHATLEAADVVVQDGVLVSLTEAGEAKVASLKTLTIPGTLGHTIGPRLLVDHKLTNLILEEGITTIQEHAFQRTGISSVSLPDSLRTVGNYAFADNALTAFNASNVESLGDYALYNNVLSTIESTAVRVGEKAFAANPLTEARLPQATFLGEGAFFDNPNLNAVYMKNPAVNTDSFPAPAFNQSEPVELYIAESVTGVSPLNKSYVINPVTLTISFKEKKSQGLIQPTPNAENAAQNWKNAVRISKHSFSEFPLTLNLPSIEGYRLSENQENVVATENGQSGTLTIPASKIQDSSANIEVYFDAVEKPQIFVSETKQLILPVNKALDAQTILQDVRFLMANGEEFEAFDNTTLKSNITITPFPIPAPNQEGTKTVNVRFTDPKSNLTTDVDITFTYSNETDEDKEIIPGKGWLYSDFVYENDKLQLKGFSASGLKRLATNKNVVLPGYHPVTKQKIEKIANNAFSTQAMDTVDFVKMDSLKSIGLSAFKDAGLKGLLNFDKLSNLTEIDGFAFTNSDSGAKDENKKHKFTEIDFTPLKKLRRIGDRAFKNISLEKVTLSDLPNLSAIDTEAFMDNALKEVVINQLPQLREISQMLFANNPSLSELTLNNLPALTKIGEQAFFNTNLRDLSLANFPELVSIEAEAFRTANLETLRFENLPKLQSIKKDAFLDNRLTEVNFKTIPSLEYLSGFKKNSFENIVLTDLPNLSTIGRDAFFENLKLNGEIVLENLPKLREIEDSSFKLPEVGNNAKIQAKIDRLILRNLPLLQNIQSSAFSELYFSELVLADLPQLREISNNVFKGSKIKTLTLENLPQLETIGSSAFKTNGNTLEVLTFKNLVNLRTIDNYAFEGNPIRFFNVTAEDVPVLTRIGNRAFKNVPLSGTFDAKTFPALEVIGSSAFEGTAFSDLIFNEHPSLRRIESGAFSRQSSKIKSLDLSNIPNLESIGQDAFSALSSKNDSLTSVRITNNPNLVELGGFADNLALENVVLENLPKLERILDSAFKTSTRGTGINRLDLTPFTSLKSIGPNAFSNTRLATLELPNSVERIETNAYSLTSLKSVDLSHLTNLKRLDNGAFDKGYKTYERFVLPETSEPIVLGQHIAALTEEQLDFSKTPNVKLKLTSSQPFKPNVNTPLIMHFDNDSQITWDANFFNADPNNPTIIYIDNITDPDRIARVPAGLLINPGKVTIEHIDASTNNPMLGLKPEVRYLKAGERVSSKTFSGYTLNEVQTNPENLLTRQGDTEEYEVMETPTGDSTIRFMYQPLPPEESSDVGITINYRQKQGADFVYHNPYSYREFEVKYDIRQIDLARERNGKLVITLPPNVAKGGVSFSPVIPDYPTTRGYYNEETRQLIFPISEFTQTNAPTITINFGFKVKPLDTPKKVEEHIRASYHLADGRRRGSEAVGPVIRPDYELPQFSKEVNGNPDKSHLVGAASGSNNEYANVSFPYTFKLIKMYRRLDRVVIKDTLPTYQRKEEDGSVVTVPAVFDPDKNPDWTLNEDGTYSASVGLNELNAVVGDNGFYNDQKWSTVLPRLILDFPRAVPQTITNNAKFEGFIHERQAQDPEKIELNSTRPDTIKIASTNKTFDPVKTMVGRNFVPGDSNPLEDFDWAVRVPLTKSSYVFEGERIYYRTQYKGVGIWDSFKSPDARNLLRFAGFTPNYPVKLELYSKAPRNMSKVKPAEMGKPFATFDLAANQRFDLSLADSLRAQSFHVVYEPTVDSDDYVTHLPPEEKKKSDRLDFDLNLVVHSRLKAGKSVPNVTKSYINDAFVESVRVFPDNPELGDDPVTKKVEARRNITKGTPQIQVFKTSNNYPNPSITYRTDVNPLDYTLSFALTGIPNDPPFELKNFNLVDIFPSQLSLKEKDIVLHPDFVKLGGTYRQELLPDGNTKITFHAPTVLGNLPWVAKLNASFSPNSPGDIAITNRAYIKTDNVPGYTLKHLKPAKTPEENNASLTTAILTSRFALNSAGSVQKYIRSASRNGNWVKDIETLPNEDIEYKIEFANTYRTALNKIAFLDVLPHIGDIEVGARLDGSRRARGSQFSNVMTSAGLTSVVAKDFTTGEVIPVQASDYPVVLISKLDGFPRNASDGDLNEWIKQVLADPSYQTTDPAQAKAVYVGGENSSIPPNSKIEFIFKARVPDFDLERSNEWRGFSAKNSVAYSSALQPEFREVNATTNTMKTPTRSIKFRKIASDTKQPVGGATFVLKQEGSPDKVAVSDKEGWLYFADVYYLPFTLQEISAPKGYQINEQVYDYNGLNKALHDADVRNPNFDSHIFYEMNDLVFENTPIPPPAPTDKRTFSFNITKKDAQDAALPYVRFRLENMADGSVKEEVTNAAGQIQFTGLRPGQYRLSEVSNINRYTLIKPLNLTLPLPDNFSSESVSNFTRQRDDADENHEIYNLEIPNRSFNLELQKIGIEDLNREKLDYHLTSSDGVKLPEVRFKLYETAVDAGQPTNGALGTLVADLSTDAKGKAKVENLKPNRIYRLEETVGVAGYERRQTPVYFYLDAEGGVKAENGSAYVRPDLLLVSNIRETVKTSASIKKIDASTGEALAGAKFQILKWVGDRYEALEENSVRSTNAQGMVYFSDLEYGRYRILEIESPVGYVRSAERFDFTAQPYGKAQHFDFVAKNKKILLKLEKVQKIAGPYTSEDLALANKDLEANQEGLFIANKTVYRRLRGAEFRVTPKFVDPLTGVPVPETPLVPSKTQNDEGYTVYEYSQGLSDFGSYLVEEVATPNGYKTIDPFSIKLDQLVNYARPEATLYVENTPKTGSVYVAKFADLAHTVLPGVTFALYKGHLEKNELDQHKPAFVAPLVENRGKDFDSLEDAQRYGITNEYGIIRWPALEMGDYTLVEIATVEPYKVLDTATHFTLTNAQPDRRFSFYNRVDTITLKLNKQNDLGEAITDLTGSVFELYYKGTLHSTGKISADEPGIILFENVPAVGEYEIREKVAPKGYAILGEGKLSFTATAANKLAENHTVVLKNKRQVSISAEKAWIGGTVSNRPQVYFKLYRQAEGENVPEAVPNVELKEIGQNDAKVDFGSFDAYKIENGVAKAYTYSVQEVNRDGQALNLGGEDSEYTVEYSTTQVEAAAENNNLEKRTLKVTNTYRSKKAKLKVKKIWKGGQKAEKPDLKFALYRKVGEGEPTPVLKDNAQVTLDVPKTSSNVLHGVLEFLGAGNNEVHNEVEFTELDLVDDMGQPYTYYVREVKQDLHELDESISFKPAQVMVEATKVDEAGKEWVAEFVNTYESPTTQVIAKKKWVNGPQLRPETHFFLRRYVKHIGLLGTTHELDTNFTSESKTLASQNNDGVLEAQVIFENLPTHNEVGEEYVYESVEFDGKDRENLAWAPQNYTKTEGTLNDNNALLTTNTYNPPKSPLIIRTVWTMIPGEIVPRQVEYNLLRKTPNTENVPVGNNPRITDKENHKIKDDDETRWKTETEDVDETDENGTPYIYDVTAKDVTGYSKKIVPIYENDRRDGKVIGFEILLAPETITRTVTKVWSNTTTEGNPSQVSLQILRTRKGQVDPYGKAVEVNETNQWTHTFTGLPTHDEDGGVYAYTVQETPITGYDAPVIAPVLAENGTQTGFTVTNRRSTMTLEVTKTWVDQSDEVDKPSEITIHLYRNKGLGSVPYQTLKLTAEGNWRGEFTNLPTHDNAGAEYVYTIEEVPVPGYTSVIQNYSVTNTRQLTTVPVTKVWAAVEGDHYPNQITYILKRGTEELARQVVNKPANPAEPNAWNYTFEADANNKKLARTNPKNNTDYVYTVEEVPVPGYTTTVDPASHTITNTQNKQNIVVKKRWLKGTKPDVSLTLKRSVEGMPQAETVMTLNTAGQPHTEEVDGQLVYTVVTFDALQLPTHDPSGKVYTYTVEEENVPDNYTPSVEGFVVTNTYNVPTYPRLQARVNWIHGKLLKPETRVRLYRQVEGSKDFEEAGEAEQSVTRAGAKDSETVEVAWNNVPQTDEQGRRYTYQIRQVNAAGVVIEHPQSYHATRNSDLEITNVFTPPTQRFSVQKTWVVQALDMLPENLTVNLYRGFTEGQLNEKVAELTLSRNDYADTNIWQKTFEEEYPLQTIDGQDYLYRLEEPNVPGFTAGTVEAVRGTSHVTGFSLTNTQNVRSIEVQKVWTNSTGEANPTEVQVQLLRNGAQVAVATLRANAQGDAHAADHFKTVFADLPTHDATGTAYTYTVTETDVPGYTKQVTQVSDENRVTKFVVENTRKEYTNIEVTKTWNDEANDLDKPASITIVLKRKLNGSAEDAVKYRELQLTAVNTWTGVFEHLPLTDNAGVDYVYTIDEVTVPGYDKQLTGADLTHTVVTNTRQLTTVPVTKTWEMLNVNDADSYPASITYSLYRDGGADPIATHTVNKPANPAAAGAWNYTFEADKDGHKLPAINPSSPAENKAYVYTVRETVNDAFTSRAGETAYSFVNAQKFTDLIVKKRWLKGTKPDVTLTLYRSEAGVDGEVEVRDFNTQGMNREELTENGNTYTVVSFPAYRVPSHSPAGNAYTYRLDEKDVPENYTKSVEDMVVTNTYNVPLGEVAAKVNWIRGKLIKPETRVRLYRKVEGGEFEVVEGEEDKNVTRDGVDNTQSVNVAWNNVPLTDESGRTYTYQIRQITPEGAEWSHPSYATTRNSNLEITNEFNPPSRTFTFQKTWNLQAGEQAPESLSLTIKRGFTAGDLNEVVEVLTLSRNDYANNVWRKESTQAYALQTDEGRDYLYKVEEPNVPGFTAGEIESVDTEAVRGFNLTNTQNVRSIEVQKVWTNPTGEANPTEVQVQLLRNGVQFREATLRANAQGDAHAADHFKTVFTDLPTHDATGTAYTYTVTESPVTAYATEVNAEGQAKFVVNNTRVTKSIEVTKTWNDEANDLDKPAEITIVLKRKLKDSAEAASEYARLALRGTGNEWTGIFENLPTTNNAGIEYIYTIDELPVPGYTTVVNDYSVTNTRQLTTVPVTKTWSMTDVEYPSGITYILKRDGTEIARQSIRPPEPAAEGAWNYTFTEDKDGKKLALHRPRSEDLYTYTVEEEKLAGYQANITPNLENGRLVSVAIHNTQETIDLELVKRWLNGKKEDVTLEVQRRAGTQGDYKIYKSFVLRADDGQLETIEGQTYTVTRQTIVKAAKYSPDGLLYDYRVVEHFPETAHYKATYDKQEQNNHIVLTVTNTYDIPTDRIEAQKIWRNLHKGLDVPSITIKLYRKYREQGRGELVPEAQPIVLEAFKHNETDKTVVVDLAFENIEKTDKDGKPYDFYILEFNEAGEEAPPKLFYRYHSIENEPLKIYNDYISLFPPPPDGTTPPIEPDPFDPFFPWTPGGGTPPLDHVPNTGAGISKNK